MKFLLATHHLSNWSGSELVTIELAEELAARGHDVDVYAAHYRDEFVAQWRNDKLNFITDASRLETFKSYDVVYAHHGMLGRVLSQQNSDAIFGERRPAFVYNHLSPTEGFERPGAFSELVTADLVLANSPETAAALEAVGSCFDAVSVMPNPAPRHFENVRRERRPSALRRLLIVSNHLPSEALQASKLLTEIGVEVKHVGLPHETRRLAPQELHDVDAVLTIGKTVQYAFRAGCPIYVYDHFGGPGWLTSTNIDESEYVNFSGRNAPLRKSPEEIFSEILEVPASAISLVAVSPERFHLEHWVDRLTLTARSSHPSRQLFTGLSHLTDQLFQCERNAFLLIDGLYDSSERYREAYQKCNIYAHTVTAELERIQGSYQEMNSLCESLSRDVIRFQEAYKKEAGKRETLQVEIELREMLISGAHEELTKLPERINELQKLLEFERAEKASLTREADRYRVAYEAECERSSALMLEAEPFRPL